MTDPSRPTTYFSDLAEVYARARPDYPGALAERILAGP